MVTNFHQFPPFFCRSRQLLLEMFSVSEQTIELSSPYGECDPSDNYVQSSCVAECEADYVISNCSCKAAYMPGRLC